jgi:ketosteroid isomerase-like protein
LEDPAVDLVRQAFECYRQRDFDALVEFLDPDVMVADATPLESHARLQGRDETLQCFASAIRSSPTTQAETRKFTAALDGRLLVEGSARYEPAGGGQGATQVFYCLCEVRDDRIARWESFTDRHKALAAAGLRP